MWSNPLLRFIRCVSATSGIRESRSETSGASYFCGFSNLSCSLRSSHLFNSSRSFRSLPLSRSPYVLHVLCLSQSPPSSF
jgi:hypothetical protein